MSKKRIWPLDDEARVSTDEILVGQQEERAGPLAARFPHTPHSISCARPRLLLHRLSRRFLRCGQPENSNTKNFKNLYKELHTLLLCDVYNFYIDLNLVISKNILVSVTL